MSSQYTNRPFNYGGRGEGQTCDIYISFLITKKTDKKAPIYPYTEQAVYVYYLLLLVGLVLDGIDPLQKKTHNQLVK